MFEHFAAWLEQLPFAVAISQGDWYFPAIECVHVLAIAVVFGSISIVDLRLLHLALTSHSLRDLNREVIPWTWVGFAVAAITGGLMFSSAATRYYGFTQFKIKMLLIVCAGINMMIFNIFIGKNIAHWGDGRAPNSARASGGLSLVLWISIIVLGRWVGFL